MRPDLPAIAVTGAGGFIGANLMVRLGEQGWPAAAITRDTSEDDARGMLHDSDVVVHLAGANRPSEPGEFLESSRDYTQWIADAVAEGGHRPLLIFSSSIKVADASDYGQSKRAGEAVLLDLADRSLADVLVYRLPNVFGKWARPNYNSAVATFCHNLARGLPIRIDDPDAPLSLLYIDDLIDQWLDRIATRPRASGIVEPEQVYSTTVGAVADLLQTFAQGRGRSEVGDVAEGLTRALYATFISALPEAEFSYPLVPHIDDRGSFTEVIKTSSCGQVACLTAFPGVTRGGHYHHSKVEKFLVVRGTARFRFRDIRTGTTHDISTSADRPTVVETIPGWTHDLTNVGDDLLVALVWANERFDPERPDTIPMPL